MKAKTGQLPSFLSATKFYKPHVFQGHLDKRPYFEGWYFKLVDAKAGLSLCLIPGVALGGNGDDHGFIQYADSISGASGYLRFSLDEIAFSSQELLLNLGPHTLSDRHIKIAEQEGFPYQMDLKFNNVLHYPVSSLHPGIMGPFRFFPAMECYHGVRIVHANVSGTIAISGREIVLTEGEIYLEKDWGRSFPREWIWLQASNFKSADLTSAKSEMPVHLMLSVANIPWIGRSFNGHLGYLWLGDERIGLGTYTGSSVHLQDEDAEEEALEEALEEAVEDPKDLVLVVNKGNYHIVVMAKAVRPVPLIAPSSGTMVRHMYEDLEARVSIEVYKDGAIYYEGSANYAGLERCGDYKKLFE